MSELCCEICLEFSTVIEICILINPLFDTILPPVRHRRFDVFACFKGTDSPQDRANINGAYAVTLLLLRRVR
jgi:hypothetical protein